MRLASPAGEAFRATADVQGGWRIAVPSLQAPAIFGLSMSVGQRQIQSQGYVLADADGAATLLRAGAGAIVLSPGAAPRITTFDYDREGGAVISGVAPAGASVTVRGDGVTLGEGQADQDGRFSIPITRPLTPGQRQVQILGEGFADAAAIEVTPAQALSEGPFRSRRTGAGLRADWMTPGGGVQTTLILN